MDTNAFVAEGQEYMLKTGLDTYLQQLVQNIVLTRPPDIAAHLEVPRRRLADIRTQSARGRERSANRPMDRMPSLTEDGAMRFLDFWESDVEQASTPKEQGQIVRFLGDVRKRFGG